MFRKRPGHKAKQKRGHADATAPPGKEAKTRSIPEWLFAPLAGTIVVFLALTLYAFCFPTPTLEIGNVPKPLEDDGYTASYYSRCIENRLLAQLEEARNASKEIQHPQKSGPSIGNVPTDLAPPDVEAEYSSMKTTGLVTNDSPIIHPVTILDLRIAPYSAAYALRRLFGMDAMRSAQVQVNILKQGSELLADIDISHSDISYKLIQTSAGSSDLCHKIGDFIQEKLYPRRYAIFLANEGQTERAEALLAYLINSHDADIAHDYDSLGDVYMREKRYDDADRAYKKAIDMHLNWAWIDVANNSLSRGDFPAAIAEGMGHLNDARDDFDRAVLYNNIGVAKEQLHDHAGAEQAFLTSIQKNAKYALGYANLCNHYLNAIDPATAQGYCAIANRLSPSNHSMLNELKAFYRPDSQSHDAFLAFLRRPQADRNADMLTWIRWIGKADSIAAAQHELDLDRSELTQPGAYEYVLGMMEYDEHAYAPAEKNLLAAASQNYAAVDAYKMAASASGRLNDGRAASYFALAAQNEEDPSRRASLNAQAAWVNRDFASALKYMEEAQNDGMHTAAFYDAWGRILANVKRYAEADDKYKTAIGKDPYFATAYLDHGDMLKFKSDWQNAARQYQYALSLRPWDLAVITSNILAQWQLAGGPDNDMAGQMALWQLSAALQHRDPDTPPADEGFGWQELGYISLRMERNQSASDAFDHCIQAWPKNERCWNLRGVARMRGLVDRKHGIPEMAAVVQDFATALTLDDTDPAAQANVAGMVNHPEQFGTTWCGNSGFLAALSKSNPPLATRANRICTGVVFRSDPWRPANTALFQ